MRSDNQDEKAAKFVVGRRTAERMRDAVAEVFPELEEIEGERPKRWRLPNGLSGIFREPLAQELAALHGVVRRLEREGVTSRPRKESRERRLPFHAPPGDDTTRIDQRGRRCDR